MIQRRSEIWALSLQSVSKIMKTTLHLAVDEKYRLKGIATQLIVHLREIAIRRQAWVIFVLAERKDTPAVNLYPILGRREDVLHFDIKPYASNCGRVQRQTRWMPIFQIGNYGVFYATISSIFNSQQHYPTGSGLINF